MNLKRLTEISPVIIGYLIFLGFFKLNLYYRHWGVTISDYLEFSEILLSFFNDLHIISFFVIVLLIQATLGRATIHTIDNRLQNQAAEKVSLVPEPEKTPSEEFPGIVPLLDYVLENFPGLVTLGMLILTLIFGTLFMIFMDLTFLYLGFMSFVQLVNISVDKFFGITDDKLSMQITIALTLFVFTFCIAQYQITKTKKEPVKLSIIKSDGVKITTNKHLIYIGKTNNYVFLSDAKNDQTVILPNSEISSTLITK